MSARPAVGEAVGRIRNARAPSCLLEEGARGPDEFTAVAITIVEGEIAAISPAVDGEAAGLDQDCGIVLPGLVDIHTHLDKGHIWARAPNPDGTFQGALAAVGADRQAHWSAEDVRARMEFSLRCAFAHGTVAIRTHLDSIGPQIGITWPVFREVRDQWADRIHLEATPLFSIEHAFDDSHRNAILEQTIPTHDNLFGCVTYMIPELDKALDKVFAVAVDMSCDLDFHVDETMDPGAHSLDAIARAALRNRFRGRILCGHCCSLSQQGEAEIRDTIARVREAGIAVVSLPMCNMYLQDRAAGRTPRRRGVTLLHELKAAGVLVMAASDNTRDPFYAYGDLDMIEVFREATRILHLDHPAGDWIRAVTEAPASMLRERRNGLASLRVGAPADLLLFRARTWTEFLARPQTDRIVLRAGRAIDTTPPDYRELDALERLQP